MKITGVTVWEVVVPTRHDAVNSPDWGDDYWENMSRFIIRINTDEGISGIGETYRGTPEGAVREAAKRLIGQDPMALCWQNLPFSGEMGALLVGWDSKKYPARPHELRNTGSPAHDAYEMAIFDLVGKALNLPVHKLLGSAYRDRIPVDFWFGRRNPEDAARRAKLAVEMGYTGLKMKAASEDPTVEQVSAILDAVGPDFKLTIDPNERFYRPAEAIRLAKRLEDFPNIALFEDPMPKWNLDWYKLFRQSTSIPVALHLGSPQDIINAIKAEACDYMNLSGGLVRWVKNAAIADAAGIPVWHGSGVDCGILEASYVHAACVARNCVLPGDQFSTLIREDDLIVDPIRIEDGHAIVPTGPGLGVELDMDAIERYSVKR